MEHNEFNAIAVYTENIGQGTFSMESWYSMECKLSETGHKQCSGGDSPFDSDTQPRIPRNAYQSILMRQG